MQILPIQPVFTASPSDAKPLSTLFHACFQHPWNEKMIADSLKTSGTMALTSKSGDDKARPNGARLNGALIFRDMAIEAEILLIAVHPDSQRRGIGSALLKAALTQLRNANTQRLFLEVNSNNQAAITLYLAHGFQVTGERKAYYKSENGAPAGNALIMSYSLQASSKT